MDYCIADVHGNYELFCRLMDRIGIGAGDRLFVVGDMLEKGPESVRLAKLLMSMPEVTAIIGNHEHSFLNYFHNLMKETEDYDGVLQKLRGYFTDGKLLDWDIVDWIESLPYYAETERFLCVHAGLSVENGKLLPPEQTPLNTLVFDRRFKDPDVLPTGGKCVFFGHTPTWYFTGGKSEILFYPRRKELENSTDITDFCKVHLDTDVCLTGVLGCVATDTCESFYVCKDKRRGFYG